MAASNIVLNDAQATPVAHTFVPIGPDKDGVFWYEDQSATNAIGYWKVSVELKRPPVAVAGQSSANRTFRVRIGLHEPIQEVVSNSTVSGIAPSPTVAYTLRSFAEYVLPERASLLDRKNLKKMLGTLVSTETQVTAAIETLLMPF
jgi:hypothetical protein